MTDVLIRIVAEACKEERYNEGDKSNHKILEPIRMVCIDADTDKEAACADKTEYDRKYGSEFFHFDMSSVKNNQ